jgi:hypothetical protein
MQSNGDVGLLLLLHRLLQRRNQPAQVLLGPERADAGLGSLVPALRDDGPETRGVGLDLLSGGLLLMLLLLLLLLVLQQAREHHTILHSYMFFYFSVLSFSWIWPNPMVL